MFNSLYYSIQIDTHYALNSLIYIIRKLPIFRDLITDDMYKKGFLKTVLGIISIFLSIGKALLLKIIYFFIIFEISKRISNVKFTFYHVMFITTIIGMLINNRLFSSSMKKYLCINIFNMDAKKYMNAYLFYNCFSNLVLNTICFFIFGYNLTYNIILISFQLLTRIIGEAIDIHYYRKYNAFWYNDTKMYFTVLVVLLLCALSPLTGIIIDKLIIIISLIISFIGAIISILYLEKFNDYKIIYKRINTIENIMNNNTDFKKTLVEVSNKDLKIDEKKLKNLEGYDYFNTIFFERHKDILLRSSKNYAIILTIIYIVLGYFVINNKELYLLVGNFLSNRLGWFVLIMLFLNRGGIVTQAMFYNCDHAMLNYNFYKEKEVILGLFKKRLKTIISVNLLPSLVIGIGNTILLIITSNSIINCISSFLFIIILSILFSVHYLVIYYLLQPYNKDMQMKKTSYILVSTITYIVCYKLSNLLFSSVIFSIIGLIFSIIYISGSIFLVKKYAKQTFKIN